MRNLFKAIICQIVVSVINLSFCDLLYGCETWSSILREYRRFVARYLKNLHDEKLRNVQLSPDIIRIMKSSRMKWAGHVARTIEIGNTNFFRKTLNEDSILEK
jgi:hypothetical protein